MCVYLSQQLRDGLLHIIITVVGTMETLTFGRDCKLDSVYISSCEWDTSGLLLPTGDIIEVSDAGLYIEVRRRQVASIWPWRTGSLPSFLSPKGGSIHATWYDGPTTSARYSWGYTSFWRPRRECVPHISSSAYIGTRLEALGCRCLHVHHFLIMKSLSDPCVFERCTWCFRFL